MKRITFEKKFTRDNCFILQEIWDDGLSRDYFGNNSPYFPPQINYLNDGAVEIWDNKKGLQWFKDRLLFKNKKDKRFLDRIVKEHEKNVSALKKILKRNHLNSTEELKRFLELIKKGTYTFLAFYYSLVNEKSPKWIKEKVIKLRKEDVFYDAADYLIKKTIEYLYPHTKGLAISVMTRELDSPPSKNILKQRFRNCVMIIDGTLEITDIDSFVKRNKKYKFLFDKISNMNILKGHVANSGYVTGRVHLLRRKNQIRDLKPGEILVTPMTTSDFVPAIQKAGAIVTDEGGIMCHAAIISRELKKPCLIGTKIATKVLKDGDFVEVDANKGIVKILKRK